MLRNPDYSLDDAASEVFWNFQDGNPKARRFHNASINKVGQHIQRRLAKTGIHAHGGEKDNSQIIHTPEENALLDLYHERLPTYQHQDYGYKLADWRKFRKEKGEDV